MERLVRVRALMLGFFIGGGVGEEGRAILPWVEAREEA